MIRYRFGWLFLFALLLIPSFVDAQSIRRIPVANTDISWDATNSVVRIRLPQYTTVQRDALVNPAVRDWELLGNETSNQLQVLVDAVWRDVYRQGGTTIAIGDGGTGASTAAAALSNLGVGTEDSPAFTGLTLGGTTSRYTITLADDQFIGHTSASGWKIGDTGVENSLGIFGNGGSLTADIDLTQQSTITHRSNLTVGVANEAYAFDTRNANLTGLLHTSWRHGGTEIASLSIAGVPTFSGLTVSRLLSTNGTKGLASTSLSSWLSPVANQTTLADDGDGTATIGTVQDIGTTSSPTFAGLTVGDGVSAVRTLTVDQSTGATLGLYTAGTERVTMRGGTDGAFRLETGGLERFSVTNTGATTMTSSSVGAVTVPLTLANVSATAGTGVELRLAPTSDPTIRYAAIRGIGVGANVTEIGFFPGKASVIDEKMRLDQDGHLGVNKLSSIGGQLHVVAKDSTTPGIIAEMAATPGATVYPIQVRTTGASTPISYFDTLGGATFTSGVTIGSGDTFSDVTVNLNDRIKVTGDGLLKWGQLAAHGVLSWDTNLAVVGGLSGNSLALWADGAEVARFDNDATAGNSRFLLYDVTAGTLKRVSFGAADSGGVGFKLLRVAN